MDDYECGVPRGVEAAALDYWEAMDARRLKRRGAEQWAAGLRQR